MPYALCLTYPFRHALLPEKFPTNQIRSQQTKFTKQTHFKITHNPLQKMDLQQKLPRTEHPKTNPPMKILLSSRKFWCRGNRGATGRQSCGQRESVGRRTAACRTESATAITPEPGIGKFSTSMYCELGPTRRLRSTTYSGSHRFEMRRHDLGIQRTPPFI